MNSLVSYITLPENGKMASTVSPFKVQHIPSFYPGNHFSVKAIFSHRCRFMVCVGVIGDIAALNSIYNL